MRDGSDGGSQHVVLMIIIKYSLLSGALLTMSKHILQQEEALEKLGVPSRMRRLPRRLKVDG